MAKKIYKSVIKTGANCHEYSLRRSAEYKKKKRARAEADRLVRELDEMTSPSRERNSAESSWDPEAAKADFRTKESRCKEGGKWTDSTFAQNVSGPRNRVTQVAPRVRSVEKKDPFASERQPSRNIPRSPNLVPHRMETPRASGSSVLKPIAPIPPPGQQSRKRGRTASMQSDTYGGGPSFANLGIQSSPVSGIHQYSPLIQDSSHYDRRFVTDLFIPSLLQMLDNHALPEEHRVAPDPLPDFCSNAFDSDVSDGCRNLYSFEDFWQNDGSEPSFETASAPGTPSSRNTGTESSEPYRGGQHPPPTESLCSENIGRNDFEKNDANDTTCLPRGIFRASQEKKFDFAALKQCGVKIKERCLRAIQSAANVFKWKDSTSSFSEVEAGPEVIVARADRGEGRSFNPVPDYSDTSFIFEPMTYRSLPRAPRNPNGPFVIPSDDECNSYRPYGDDG